MPVKPAENPSAQMLPAAKPVPAILPVSRHPRIPDHELLAPIASGAYGEVWLARSVVGTLRAIKIVRRDRHTSVESFEREFKGLQKFEPVSRAHDGLVDILTLGLLPDGAGFYYVMELADGAKTCSEDEGAKIEGGKDPESGARHPPFSILDPQNYTPRTLRADFKARGALPADEVIALGLKLTAALAHLHAQGLVHRDVKPSNILFIGGEPKLADAGLVAAVDDARSLVGTAGYIAPEGPGTPQADLYALGKVLYEAAFGKDRQEFPALPADVASRPDHARLLELNAILLKACATDARERYQSADEMRADLELLHAGRPVKRRQVWQQTKRTVTKVAVGCAVVAVLSAAVYSLAPKRSGPPEFIRSKSEEANREYREGMVALHARDDKLAAIGHFERAIAIDPNFAEAYARMAFAWLSFFGPNNIAKAREAAEKAVTLNPNSAAAHAFLASAEVQGLDWAGGEKERTLSLRLNPNSEEILLESALNLAVMGRTSDAVANLEKALQQNPDDTSNLRMFYSAFVYGWARQYDRAIGMLDQLPLGGRAVERQVENYLAKGDYTNAIRLERKAALARGENTNAVKTEFDALQKAFADGGEGSYWQRRLEFERPKTGKEQHLIQMALILARLNRSTEAFGYLQQAMKETPKDFVIMINTNPSFDSLRKDQRFLALTNELWRKK